MRKGPDCDYEKGSILYGDHCMCAISLFSRLCDVEVPVPNIENELSCIIWVICLIKVKHDGHIKHIYKPHSNHWVII